MIRLYIVGVLAILASLFSFYNSNVSALSSDVVISQVQLGDSASVKNEFVELYNNSSEAVDISNWCLYYVTSSQTASKMVCFVPTDGASHIYLPGHLSLLAVSNELMTAALPMLGDFHFTGVLSGISGNVRLQNNLGVEIDKVGWGASTPELDLVAAAPAGSVLNRKNLSADILKETDVNSADFEIIAPRVTYHFGYIYEVEDVCANLDGAQATLPIGYVIDGVNCVLPTVDVCPNLDGVQVVLPIGMKRFDDDCLILPLQISEILPNAIGSDTGGEFIEIYNPNDVDINLNDYLISIGPDYSHNYQFPLGAVIGAGKFAVIYNDDVKFTLLNTAGSVRLQTIDNLVIFETLMYDNPPEGFSWVFIDNRWQYTSILTPGSLNILGLETAEDEAAGSGNLAPCSVGQERNPETNRCRKIGSSSSVIAPCKDGQYRSEETNRCRSILSDVSSLAVCAEGQERNPKTNRCRSIATNADAPLEPCKEGQERNPDTNRCRNVSKMVSANYAPEKTVPISNYFGWWVLGGVGVVAAGYGIWEWRREIGGFIRKVTILVKRKK